MIKKIIGVLAALVILVLIVFTAIGVGTYKSMLPEGLFSTVSVEKVEPQTPVVEQQTPAVEPVATEATEPEIE